MTATPGPHMRSWLEAGLGLVWPNVCQVCEARRAMAAAGFVCERCREQIQPVTRPFCDQCGLPFDGALTTEFSCGNCRDIQWHFTYARAAVVSKTVARHLILSYKYRGALWFESLLAELLVRAAAPELAEQRPAMIVPVPLHPVKERQREFNQAARLGGHLARALGIPLNTTILRRVLFTETQTQFGRAARARNMLGVFAMKPGVRLAGESIVLVDDVFTTGATTNACAAVLRKAGAGPVCVWTAARQI